MGAPGRLMAPAGAAAGLGEQRFRRFMESTGEGIWRFEVNPPVSLSLPEEEQVSAILERGRLVECNDAFARQYGYERAGDLAGFRLPDMMAGAREEQARLISEFIRSGCSLVDFETADRDRNGESFAVANNVIGIVTDGCLTGGWGAQRDITSQKRAERSLRESEERLRSLVENISDAIVVLDMDGLIHYESPSIERQLGYRPEERMGRSALDLVHPEDHERLIGMFAWIQGHPDLASPVVGTRLHHKDGSWRFIEAVAKSLPVSSGLPMVVVTLRDVTEQRRVAEELRESEATLRALINALPEPAFLMDADSRILTANQSLASSVGARNGDVVGQRALDLFPASRNGKPEWIGRAVRATGPLQWEEERGGRHFLNHVYPVLDEGGAPARVAVYSIDISERKRAEERLASLAAAVEQTDDDVLVTDINGRVTYVNPAFERTTGLSLGEVVGQSSNVLEPGKHDDDPPHREMRQVLRSGRSWRGRFTRPGRDGRPRHQDVNISPIRAAGGGIIGYVATRRDITRQVEMEAHAAQTDKLEALGTLAGGIAHDFNNLLSAIVGYTQLAMMKCRQQPAVQTNLEAVLQASGRAADLVKQILAFSRQEGREERPVQVSLVAREALKFLRASIPSTIEIRKEIATDAVVLADPTEIQRVLLNLCTNAALAMPEHHGVLRIGLTEVELTDPVRTRHLGITPGSFVRLSVGDTGRGMSREIMAHIFEPFFTTREQGKGNGMGLAVVHGIVKRCRGAITVDSAPGKGATFDVYLPAVPREAPAAPPAAETPVSGVERILFVEDEPMVNQAVVGMLRELGYAVQAHSGSLSALTSFEVDPNAFDLVITDMTMPGMTGDVLARQLKNVRPDIPVMLCTGYSERATADTARGAGVDEFLMKPVLMRDLSAAIRRLLDRP